MPLQQTTLDGTTRLYDSETVKRALTRAAEIEAQKNDVPFTAVQIEALGRELGLSPDAVRRSLGELEGMSSSQALPQRQALVSQTHEKLFIFPEGRDIVAAILPGVFYGVFTGILFGIEVGLVFAPGLDMSRYPMTPLVQEVIVFHLPLLLALWSGWQRRDWRLGALSGLTLSLLSYLGMCMAVYLSRASYGVSAFPGAFLAAIALGIFGGLCGHAQKRAKVVRAIMNNE